MGYVSGNACRWDGCSQRAMLHVHYGIVPLGAPVLRGASYAEGQNHADLCSVHIEQVNAQYGHVSGNEIGRCSFEQQQLPSRIIRRRPRRASQIF